MKDSGLLYTREQKEKVLPISPKVTKRTEPFSFTIVKVLYKTCQESNLSCWPKQSLTCSLMKNIQAFLSLAAILLMVTMSGCELIGDIFQAGMWFALIIVAIVIILILWIIRKIRGPRTRL